MHDGIAVALLGVVTALVMCCPHVPARAQEVECVSIAFPTGDGEARLERYEEDAEQVSFVVMSKVLVRLRLRPRAFAIEAGHEYSINSSYYDPWFARAEADGELVLDLDSPRNCTLVIEDARGGNLIGNPSLEKLGDDGMPIGWEVQIEGQADGPVAESSTALARTGARSLRLQVGLPSVTVRSREGVPVVPGLTYLLSGYYHLEGAQHGSAVSLSAALTAPCKEDRWFGDQFLHPLVLEDPGVWRRAFFSVTVPEDYSEGSLQLVLSASGAPFVAYWDDLEVRLAPRPAPQYTRPLTDAEVRSRYSAEEVLAIVRGRAPVKVEPPVIGLSPLRVNGRPVHTFAYASHPDVSAWPRLSDHRAFLEAGVQLHFIPAAAPGGHGHEQALWLDDGIFDFTPLEGEIATALGHDPDACLLLYLYLQPYRAFGDKHPEARWVNALGQWSVGEKEQWRPATERAPDESWAIAYAAPSYRREAARFMRALGEYLASSDLGRAVVGVHIAGGTDGQWFVPGWGRDFGDFDQSPGALEGFREWLRRQYSNDVDSFRRAWGDPSTTFETATMPKEHERAPHRFLLRLDEGTDRRIYDANLFEQEGVADSINLLARAFKEAIGRPSLVFTYYPKKHYALRVLLGGPWVDGIVGVMEYGRWRALGMTGHNESSPGSLRLHNKIFLTEMDFRTEYSDSWGQDANEFRKEIVMTKAPEQAANQVRRDLGSSLAQCQGAWIYALPGNSWVGPEHMAYIEEGAKAARRSSLDPLPDDRGQMAVFMDERIRACGSERDIWGPLMHYMGNYIPRTTLNRTGLTWDDYLLTDLDNANRPDYKINIFTTASTIMPEQIEWVKRNLQRDGHVLVFVNAAGMSMGEGFERNIRELTGMTVKCDLSDVASRGFVPTGSDPLSEGVEHLLSSYSGPTFYVEDPTATPLALLTGTDRVGMAVKRHPGWTSVYISLLGGFTPRFLRNLAGEAGVVPVGPEDDVTYSGNGFLVIHALRSGEKTLRWTGRADVLDLASGETVARGVESYTVTMRAWETRWFRRIPIPG